MRPSLKGSLGRSENTAQEPLSSQVHRWSGRDHGGQGPGEVKDSVPFPLPSWSVLPSSPSCPPPPTPHGATLSVPLGVQAGDKASAARGLALGGEGKEEQGGRCVLQEGPFPKKEWRVLEPLPGSIQWLVACRLCAAHRTLVLPAWEQLAGPMWLLSPRLGSLSHQPQACLLAHNICVCVCEYVCWEQTAHILQMY